MNSRRTIGSRPLVGSSSTSNSGSGQIAPMSASCVRWPLERWLVFLFRIELEALEQIGFDVAVPMFAERREIFQRLAHGHPRIKRDHVRHIGEARFHRDFILARVEAEHARRAGIGPEQIQQAFDGGGFARAVAAEKAVAFAGAHVQAEAVDGVQLAVAAREVLDFDDGRWCSYECLSIVVGLFPSALRSKQSSRSLTSARNASRSTCR